MEKAQRLISLDVLRGITIAGMIIVTILAHGNMSTRH